MVALVPGYTVVLERGENNDGVADKKNDRDGGNEFFQMQ